MLRRSHKHERRIPAGRARYAPSSVPQINSVNLTLHLCAPWAGIKISPFLRAQLKDKEIADVLTYVRSEWGNQADPVTVESVGKMREAHKGRSAMWTLSALEKL